MLIFAIDASYAFIYINITLATALTRIDSHECIKTNTEEKSKKKKKIDQSRQQKEKDLL